VVDWLDGAAACRPAEPDEPVDDDELVAELVAEVADEVELAAVLVTVVDVVVLPLLAEDAAPWESSSQPVRATAPATLAAAAIRRPLQAGWGRRRRARAVGGGGRGGALGEGASMEGLRS
jgi:hypothetical protein